MSIETIGAIVIALVGTGGLAALFKALKTAKPEATLTTVMAAEKVVIIQLGEIERLQESANTARKESAEAVAEARKCRVSLTQLTGEVQALRTELTATRKELEETRRERDELHQETTRLQHVEEENTRLQNRVQVLEARVQELERRESKETS